MAAACGTRSPEAAAHGRAATFGIGRLGFFVVSAAITWSVIEPPPVLDKNAYFLALSGAFFAGMAHVTASVVLPTNRVAAAVAGLRQAPFKVVAHGGRLGLLAASTAITLAALGDRWPPPGVGNNNTRYFLVLSGAFFAGVAQVVASVSAGDGGRPRDAARKLVYASLVLLVLGASTDSNQRGQGEATGDGGAPKRLHHYQAAFGRGLLGLAAASAAITMAVSEPSRWLDRNAYFVALSCAFFAAMTQVIASVRGGDWVAGGRGHGTRMKLVVLVVVAAGLTAASLLM